MLTTVTTETVRLALLPYATLPRPRRPPRRARRCRRRFNLPAVGQLDRQPNGVSRLLTARERSDADQRQRRTRAVFARTPTVLSRWSGTFRSASTPVLHAPSAGNRFGQSRASGKVGGYTWAAVNTYGKLIDRPTTANAKRRANLVNLRLNRDIGERTVIGAMAVHKHQSGPRCGPTVPQRSPRSRARLDRHGPIRRQLHRQQPPLCLPRLDRMAATSRG